MPPVPYWLSLEKTPSHAAVPILPGFVPLLIATGREGLKSCANGERRLTGLQRA